MIVLGLVLGLVQADTPHKSFTATVGPTQIALTKKAPNIFLFLFLFARKSDVYKETEP